jgi:hypothetical protein
LGSAPESWITAEVTGEKLAEEGKRQANKTESEPLVKPLGNLDKPT